MPKRLAEAILSSFIAFESDTDTNAPIHQYRRNAIKKFEQQGFPKRKDPYWDYTSLENILTKEYTLFPKKDPVSYSQAQPFFIDNTESYKIVFINGIYDPILSETTHEGMDICLFSAAINKEKYHPVLFQYFNKSAEQDLLSQSNTALAQDGAYIHIPKKKIHKQTHTASILYHLQ